MGQVKSEKGKASTIATELYQQAIALQLPVQLLEIRQAIIPLIR